MASGFSKRFGKHSFGEPRSEGEPRSKLLVPFRGKPLARYTLELAAGIKFDGGIFFIAADAADAASNVASLAADFPDVKVIKNHAPEKDLRESVRLGVEAAGEKAEYYVFFPCDQPFLDAATVQSILDAGQPGRIVEPRFRGIPGNPCLFSAVFRKELLSLEEGEMPRIIKARHPEALMGVEVSNPLVLSDIDDEETFARLTAAGRSVN
jgi:molybdenum cofactor cytidylyltransferase